MAGLEYGSLEPRISPAASLRCSDEVQNPLQKPLLKKVQKRSRPITREESRIKQTWVYITTFVAVLGGVSLGFALGYSSPVQIELTETLNLSLSEFSFFGSMITVGAMAGSVVSGRNADYFGRKGGLAVASIFNAGGFLLIAVAQSTLPLYIGRFATGVSGGLVCFLGPVLIAEIAPRNLRGTLGAMVQVSVTFGIFLAYLVGLFLHWRFLAAAGTIPSILCLIGLIFIPESPRWLAKVEREENLEASLRKLRGNDYDISQELGDIKASTESAKNDPPAQISDLFKRKYASALLAGCGLLSLQQCTGINGVMLYSGAIFVSAGVANAKAAALSLAALQLTMTCISASVMDKAGRRLLLLISLSGMFLSLFLVGLSFYLKGFADEGIFSSGVKLFIGILSLASLMAFVVAFSVGIGPVPWVVMSEVFPNQVKGVAGSLATLLNWVNAWIVTLTFNFLLVWGAAETFWLYSALSLGGVIFVALFVPETRGKTLEEIEQSFTHVAS